MYTRIQKARRTSRLYLRQLVLASMLLLAADVVAEQQYERRAATALISADVYDEMIKAQEAQEAGDIKTALAILDGLKARSGRRALKPYELAQLWNFYAYAYVAEDDYGRAIEAFEKLLQQNEVPDQLALSTRYTLAQLYFAQDNVGKSIELLEVWFRSAQNPAPDAYVMLAQAYLQSGQLDPALSRLQQAFVVARQQNREERENWYALLQYIHAEKDQHAEQIKALEVLVSRWPKQSYWLALVGVYGEQRLEARQLAAMDAAYLQGMLNQESYIISYAQLLAANNIPYRAARVLEDALDKQLIKADAKNLERIGEYYRRAQEIEKAIPFLQKASQQAEDGETAIRLSYVYINRHYYQEAVSNIRLALDKGGIEKPLDARFLLAQALFHAGELAQSRQTLQDLLRLARQQEATRIQQQASQWLRFVEGEIRRQKDIDTYLKN